MTSCMRSYPEEIKMDAIDRLLRKSNLCEVFKSDTKKRERCKICIEGQIEEIIYQTNSRESVPERGFIKF